MKKFEKVALIILNGLAVLAIVLMFLVPLLSNKITSDTTAKVIISGWDYYFGSSLYDKFEQIGEYTYGVMNPCTILMIGLALVFAAVAQPRAQQMRKLTAIAIGLILVGTVINLVNGIVMVNDVLDFHEQSQNSIVKYIYDVSTASYWPMIVAIIAYIGYVVVAYIAKNKQPEKQEEVEQMQKSVPQEKNEGSRKNAKNLIKKAKNLEEASEILTKYKELLDAGIITQEEYERIKNKTFGN